MKRVVLISLAIVAVLLLLWGVDRALATGCNPTALGGTGTCTVPSTGELPIGNGSGSYTPATLTPGANIAITNASGSVTIGVTGTATGTVYLLQGGHGISLSPASITSSGTIAVNTSTVIADVVASGQFLPSSTTYVATVNGQSGAVTIGVPATTTVNGTQATVFHLIGDGTTVTSTVNGATTTFSIVTTGNWQGTWQGVNSSTFYKASNPSGYISGNQTITFVAAGDATGTATGTTLISDTMTVTGLEGKALPALATGTLKYSGGAWTFDGNTYLTSGVNVTTTGPLDGGGPLTSAGLTLTCATCLTGNQTITLTGAVTGSGTTSIATTYATSTLYALFSGSGPITFNASTGAIGWTNSLNYVTGVAVNGQSGTSFSIVAGPGLSSSVSGATTTISVSLNNGTAQTCSANQFVNSLTSAGVTSCGTITFPTAPSTTITFYVAASNASSSQKAIANFVCTGTDDGACINSAIAAASTSNAGLATIRLSPGTFNISSTTVANTKNGIVIQGDGQLATVFNCTSNTGATSTACVHLGNAQVTDVNTISPISDLTVDVNNTTTVALWIDGMGQGSYMRDIDTNGGYVGALIEDVDRSDVTNVRASNAYVAGIDFRVGKVNTFGKLYTENLDANVAYANGSAIRFDADPDQGSPNPPDIVSILNSHMQQNSGVATGTCMDFLVQTRDLVVMSSAFEDCTNQVETNGLEVDSVWGPADSFINSLTNSANIFDAEGYANITVYGDTFQQATNVFNGGSGYPNFQLLGASKNNGNLTNLWAGGFASKTGTDLNFAGNNTLSLGTASSNEMANVYAQNFFENGYQVATSSVSAVATSTYYTISVNPAASTRQVTPANTVIAFGFPVTQNVVFDAFVGAIGTADSSSDDYDIGLYVASGTNQMSLLADTGAITFRNTGVFTASTTQGGTTLSPSNKYYIAITGVSTTLKFDTGYATFTYLFDSNQSASSGGQLPATSSIAADSWTYGAAPALMLINR